MKVLMINTFHHPRGGDATYTRGLSRLLESAGHTVIPLAMRHPDNEPSPWEQRFVSWVDPRGARTWAERLRVLPRALWSHEAARAAAALVAEERPDLAHLQHVHRHLTPSVLGPLRAAKIPVVWTLHDYELICPAGTLFSQGRPCERCQGHRYSEAVRLRCKWGDPLASAAAALEKTLHHWAGVWERVDHFLAPSQFLADALVRFGLPAARITHIPNFVDATAWRPSREPGQGWVFAGRLTDEKGVDVLLEAARRIPEVPGVICGVGPAEGRLRARARDLPQVRFLGHLPSDQLAETLRRSAVVAVPSLWPENFPYAVTEAQACGRPVVASAVGGIPEQIDPCVDGVLVPPGDAAALARAIAGLVENPSSASAIGAAGRHRIEQRLRPADHLNAVMGTYRRLT